MVFWNFTPKVEEEEEVNPRMDDIGGPIDPDPGREGEESVEEGSAEISYRAAMEAAMLELASDGDEDLAGLRLLQQIELKHQQDEDHHHHHLQPDLIGQVGMQHRDSGIDNLGFGPNAEVSGDGNLGFGDGVVERGHYSFLEGGSESEHLGYHDTGARGVENGRMLEVKEEAIEELALMHERVGNEMISEIELDRGHERMERKAVFGALAAAAVAVNVALQSISGAGSMALHPTTDVNLEHRRFRKRKRKGDDETDFIPAVLSTFADAEVMASLSLSTDPSPRKDPFLFDDIDWFQKPRSKRWWRKLFRVSKPTFDYICQLVKPDIESDTPASFQGIEGRVITVEKQVAIALRRLASGDSLTILGDLFGVGESTVSKVIWKFVNSMEKRARHHLQWPEGEEMDRVKTGFEVEHCLPNCCGVVDVTHILMELPGTDNAIDWFDREQNYSTLVQVVVDMDMRIRDLFTGWPGSITDSRLLRNSPFFAYCENGERLNGPRRTVTGIEVREYVIGDSGYPLLPWLVNPYADTGAFPSRDTFNSRHAATKAVVEDALGRLKGAWKILHKVLWRPDIRKLPSIILVCCLLHNILIEAGEELEDGVALVGHHDEGYRQQWCLSVEPGGHLSREALAEHAFANQ